MFEKSGQLLRRPRFDHTVKGLYHHLAHTLAGAHDIGGIHRLIRADQDKAPAAAHHGRICCLICTDHIIFNSLGGAVLHQGHMLMRRRMIYDLRSVGLKHLFQTPGITDRSDQHFQLQIRILFL